VILLFPPWFAAVRQVQRFLAATAALMPALAASFSRAEADLGFPD